MKKYSKTDHILLAKFALRISQRVLKHFKKENSKDSRPQNAIKELKNYIKTGICKMTPIRKTSLDSHKSAKKVKENKAIFAAHSIGQAVATAHVPQHAFGAAYYAIKIANEKNKLKEEFDWQLKNIPKHLKEDLQDFYSTKLPKNLRIEGFFHL
jgi:hypothetical protein